MSIQVSKVVEVKGTSLRGWEPIESAPKDGLPVLLGRHGVPPVVGQWTIWAGEPFWEEWMYEMEPTHWMDIPPLPGDPPPLTFRPAITR